MQALIRWSILVLLLFAFAPVPGPAHASFGDCASADYRAQFDERFRHVEYDCVERLRVPIRTADGDRHIRIIHDRNADWIVRPGELADFDRAVRAAAEAIGRLGGVHLADITVLLADDFTPPEGAVRFSDIAAWAEFTRDDECHVTVFLIGPAGSSEHAAYALVHEIFHCVQTDNLQPEQIATSRRGMGGGGDWWIEGSADWFAALAIPDAGALADRIDAFDARSPTTPLNDMAYEAVPFFLWLGGARSPPAVMTFLQQMADSAGVSAQRAAMAAALPQDEWLHFAQAYLDGDIRHPHGTALGFEPAQGEIWEWSATQTRTAPLEPFVLHRGIVAFQCGHWRTSARPDRMTSARLEDGGAWGPLPTDIDTSSGSGGSYRFAAINAGASRVTLTVQATMESGCGNCMDIVETDACLFGAWQLTGGGAVEWMRQRGVPGNYSTQNETITFRRDGSYITGAMQGEGHYVGRSGTRADGEIAAQAGGRWSTRGGQLNLCADMQALSGQTVYTTPEGARVTVPVPAAPPTPMTMPYSCAESRLRTETPIRGSPPIVSEYTRIAGE